jgi:hypothetical protein
MAYDHESVILAQYKQLAADRAQAVADYELGRTTEDEYGTMYAADRILQVDQKRMALDRIAHNYVAEQTQPQANQYGLSKDEQDIARGMFGSDRGMTDEQRDRIYAENKAKLKHLRATGQYRDDQGSVRR